jgi:hypothetical protein
VVGIDLSETGIARAHERARELGLAARAHFQVADIISTGLPDAVWEDLRAGQAPDRRAEGVGHAIAPDAGLPFGDLHPHMCTMVAHHPLDAFGPSRPCGHGPHDMPCT